MAFNEEYAIEALWHEILHIKSKNTKILPSIDSTDGFSRSVAETINQLIARNSYGKLLANWGRKPLFVKQIMEQGHSYKYTLQNLRELLSKANKALMKDYTDIDVKINSILTTMYKGTKKWIIKDIFNFIEMKDFDSRLEIFP